MATIIVVATNELPAQMNKVTALAVDGVGFAPCDSVVVTIHLGDSPAGKVIAHWSAPTDGTGTLLQRGSFTPRLACDDSVTAVAHGIGTTANATSNVICP